MYHLGLQLIVLRLILLQHVQKKGSRLSDSVALQEEVCKGVEVHGWPRLLGNHLGQVDSSLGVIHHEALHEIQVVRLVAGLPAVCHQLIEVSLASQPCAQHTANVQSTTDVGMMTSILHTMPRCN